MDLAEFLARVVPAGGFACIVSRTTYGGMAQRFFPRDKLGDAAGWVKYLSDKTDVWYAPASYRTAAPNGKDKLGRDQFKGPRTQENVEALRSFWIDLDLKRAGDNKTNVYANFNEAVQWLGEFRKAAKMPAPNLWVSSGYGLHLYWVLEDAITLDVWEPYAHALKAAFVATGAKADVGCTADSARIMRPPKTKNFKVPASPVDTKVLKSLGDYPNQLIYDKLQPYLGAVPAKVAGNYGSDNLTGAPPAVLVARGAATTAAAQANLPGKRGRLYAEIASGCVQIQQSLATGGKGDPYPLWYLGFMSLAAFCSDGNEWAHKLSLGDPRYTPAAVDAAVQQAEKEHLAKGTGAPTCANFDSSRPGVCGTCPHWGKTNSPVGLATKKNDDDDLPPLYRRNNGVIEHLVETKDGERWMRVVAGSVCEPTLDYLNGVYQLTFIYERAGRRFPIRIDKPIPTEPGRIDAYFHAMGMTLPENNAKPWRDFVVAWINELRDKRAEREQAIPPFGWAIKPDNDYGGFSVGGRLYKPDGTEEPAPGGDPKIIAMYQPCGKLEEWQKAAQLVTQGRPDLQVLVAAAFAAPLIEFTGQPGVLLSVWSRDSAVGKSSAFQIGTTVWARPAAMFSYKDTSNSISYRIGKTRVMPSYWDEVPLDQETAKGIVDLLFTVSQGKEKARLSADATLKDSGDWKTIIVCSSNRALMDHVEALRNDTNAGAVRLFEFHIAHPQMALDTTAATLIGATEKNAGNAGRVYAAWLAKNYATARTLVEGFGRKLVQELSPYNEERYYIAGMSAIMAGVSIASLIQVDGQPLVDFDRQKIWAFLLNAFHELRARRVKNLPVGGGIVDLDKIYGKFVSEYTADLLVTTRFKRPGPTPKNGGNMKVIWAPRKQSGRLAIHIATMDRLMRVDRDVWDLWCRHNNYSGSDLFQQMLSRWNATEARGVIGAGTHYQSGRVAYFELPLTHPDLTQYIYDSSDSPAGVSVAAIAPAMAGGVV
jgi:hypothetical protein